MKIGIKSYAKYIIYVLAVLCLIFLLIFNYSLYPLKYKNIIINYSDNYNVDKALIASVICVESSFNKNAISKKGAMGLMQLMPSTAKWVCEQNNIIYEEEQLLEPEFNVKVGTCYLKYLIKKFANIDNAILAYNAGEGTVLTWLNNANLSSNGEELNTIPYKETSSYLIKVKRAINIYRDKF